MVTAHENDDDDLLALLKEQEAEKNATDEEIPAQTETIAPQAAPNLAAKTDDYAVKMKAYQDILDKDKAEKAQEGQNYANAASFGKAIDTAVAPTIGVGNAMLGVMPKNYSRAEEITTAPFQVSPREAMNNKDLLAKYKLMAGMNKPIGKEPLGSADMQGYKEYQAQGGKGSFMDYKKELIAAQGKAGAGRLEGLVDVRKENIHNQNMKETEQNPILKGMMDMALPLQRSVKNIKTLYAQGQPVPATTLHELQEGIRKAQAGKGQSGVSERSEDYLNNIDTKINYLFNKYGSNVASIPSNDPIVQFLAKEANNVLLHNSEIAQGLIDTTASGHESFYGQKGNEGRKKDFENKIKNVKNVFGYNEEDYSIPSSSEDAQALDWAKTNPDDPRAKKIILKLSGKGVK